ncbi:MBL fold metallo-hydrolase RNA specificity domain-containing protein [Colwelliaceae bacterium 6471]
MATITFYGAAQEVTGSCYLLNSPGLGRVLLDCGLHQGSRRFQRLGIEEFRFSPATIDAVILSHAHLDHSGQLPALVHQGFEGVIYCTRATVELLPVMLFDAFSLYENELKRENLKLKRKGKEEITAKYSKSDVVKVLALCQPFPYQEKIVLNEFSWLRFYDAGHILGSAIVELSLTEQGRHKTLVFTGDLGNKSTLLMNDPAILTHADLVLMEGTYGDRNHRTLDDTLQQFKQILHEAFDKGGNVLIPAFAVGRTQELLLYLGQLQQLGELDDWSIFLDSPMAIEVTKIYDKWLPTLDCEGIKTLCSGEQTLLKNFIDSLHLTVTTEESIAINSIQSGAIIIAGSGMCTGGRITHHFKHRIWNNCNTCIFVGFQANGTLGRALVDGATHIKLFGEEFIVKANIETLGGFSAHADQAALLEWVANFTNEPAVVLVHGEAEVLDNLSEQLWQQNGMQASVPILGQSIGF